MSIAADTFAADESLALRRDLAAIRQELTAAKVANAALERKIDRLQKAIRTLRADEQATAFRREALYREVL